MAMNNTAHYNREGTQSCPSTKNWIKVFLSMAPPIRIWPSFPHSQSLPSGSFHKPLILIHQRADRMKTHSIRKLIKLITWTTALSNSMKLLAMHVGPPKMDRSWWRVLTKRGPLEKGMANHLSILVLRIPWTVWKGQVHNKHLIC